MELTIYDTEGKQYVVYSDGTYDPIIGYYSKLRCWGIINIRYNYYMIYTINNYHHIDFITNSIEFIQPQWMKKTINNFQKKLKSIF